MDFDWLIFHEGHNVVNSSFSGLWFILFVSFLSLLMMLLSSSIGQRARRNRDSKIAFECGFDPMSNPRMPFSLPYFLVALLFLVFDVEVVLLLSACYSLKVVFIMLSPASAMLGIIFCLILFVGLVHEFNEGSLEWRF